MLSPEERRASSDVVARGAHLSVPPLTPLPSALLLLCALYTAAVYPILGYLIVVYPSRSRIHIHTIHTHIRYLGT